MSLEFTMEQKQVSSVFKKYRNTIDIYTEDTYVSYSSCGMPYYIEGDFEDYHNLIVRTPEEF